MNAPHTATGLAFARMHGCGNDFVVIDDRAGLWHARRELLAQELCDRRKGLGGDGLILIQDGDAVGSNGADFRMTYVNRTGMDGEMCGNGARCTVLRAAQLGIIEAGGTMATDAGPIRATLAGRFITLQMTPPVDERPAQIVGGIECRTIDTGVPHVVVFLADEAALNAFDVDGIGRKLRHHAAFAPRGVNANFAVRRADGSFRMRTYERGVEMETLACGTGAVAVGLMAHRKFGSPSPVAIHPTGGGMLEIGFRVAGSAFVDVTLAGPAELIAEGEISGDWLAAHGLTPVAAG